MAKRRGGAGKDRGSAQDHLRQAQTAYAAAVKALDDPAVVPEDRPLDPALLAQALEHYRQAAAAAAAAFTAAGPTTLQAQALLGQAEVLLRMPLNTADARERVSQAEQCARAAMERLDCVQEPALALRGFLLLGEAARYAAQADPQQKEARLRGLSSLLESAAYLAQEQDDPLSLARVRIQACHVLSERFERERDENLLDAIDLGERAAELLRELPETRAFELPALLHHLGNCCIKVGGDRMRWLAQGRDWYREGAAVVDARRYPRLHRALSSQVAMAEALLAQRDHALPEMEWVARYGSGIQAALNQHDGAKARALAWGFLAWAWSLPATPNVHIGTAHTTLAKVAISFGSWQEAQHHLHHAVGVLAAVLSQRDPRYHLLQEARDLLGQALQQTGQAESLALWLDRAAQSFAEADAACTRGARLIDEDRAAALPHFEHALNVFPCHPAARFYRGVVRMLQRNLAGALEDFDFSLQLKPKNLPAHINRAGIKLRLGDLEGALADLDTAVDIDPVHVDARRMRAQIHEQRGELEKAAVDLELALTGIADPQLKAGIEKKMGELRDMARVGAAARVDAGPEAAI